MSLKHEIAVVIGGARGTGRACVEALLQKGARVCFGDVSESVTLPVYNELVELYGEPNVIHGQCDVRDAKQVKELFSLAVNKWGTMTIMINVAGYLDEFQFEKCIDINVKGSVISVNAALDHMGKDNGGSGGVIILMSSLAGVRPVFWAPIYAATKAAVATLVRSMAEPRQYERHGVRFNCVCPGQINTAFVTSMEENKNFHDADMLLNKMLPKTTMQTPLNVAEAFMELVDDTTKNGQALIVSNSNGRVYCDFPQIDMY